MGHKISKAFKWLGHEVVHGVDGAAHDVLHVVEHPLETIEQVGHDITHPSIIVNAAGKMLGKMAHVAMIPFELTKNIPGLGELSKIVISGSKTMQKVETGVFDVIGDELDQQGKRILTFIKNPASITKDVANLAKYAGHAAAGIVNLVVHPWEMPMKTAKEMKMIADKVVQDVKDPRQAGRDLKHLKDMFDDVKDIKENIEETLEWAKTHPDECVEDAAEVAA
jgi:hypothetical protein